MMSSEDEIKKLLSYRETMEQRLAELHLETNYLKTAMQEIDKLIVTQGFKTLTVPEKKPSSKAVEALPTKKELEQADDESINVTSKDGTILGRIIAEDHSIVFVPSKDFNFTLDIPPFQSFLIDRVLENMRKSDEERATKGELDPQEIMVYEVEDENGTLARLTVSNYGGERRLREINSSLRWALDKMYDKLTQG